MSLRTFILTEVIPLPTSQQQLNPPWAFDDYRNAINTIQQTAASADDPKLLDLSLKLFDNDAGRRTSNQSRPGSMTSAITLAATLVTGVGFTTLRDTIGLSSAAFWAIPDLRFRTALPDNHDRAVVPDPGGERLPIHARSDRPA